MQKNGYQTAIIGKRHLGTKKKYQPKGFDYWNILPGQRLYYNPIIIENGKLKRINDDYKNKADAASHANMRIENALSYVGIKVKCHNLIKRYLSIPVPDKIEGYSLETNEGYIITFESKQQLIYKLLLILTKLFFSNI
ncbi:MAG: hypothetical protein ACTSRZ_12135 [Promethearchaeota archaeon]